MRSIRCRVGEAVQIGDEVQLIVEATGEDTVWLGVRAPRDVQVRAVSGQQDDTLANGSDAISTRDNS
ncbi:MAG: carbon storage regulator [Salinisphaera sp.]|jgi:hypothetical protein|nr:carbon storage regulator [Salinisphaera sp.]